MSLSQSLEIFRASIQENNQFIASAFTIDEDDNYAFPLNMRQLMTEAAFLKVFISWESFLEQSLIKYLTGKKSIAGNTVGSCLKRIDMGRASQILIGTNKYIDWSNPDIVIRIAKLYFGSENPYGDHLNPIKTDLLDLRTIRNAAAHLSTTTIKSLDSLASRLLQESKSNVSVSDFVLTLIPETTDTVVDYYLNLLDITAENIASV